MSSSLSSSISTQGFHFTVSTTVNISSWSEVDQCSLHVLYHIHPHLFADQYELAQRPDHLTLFWGSSDLEKPVAAFSTEHTVLLLTADLSRLAAAPNITLEVPLHARYGHPALTRLEDAYRGIELKRPIGFFSCATNAGTPVPNVLRPFTSLAGWPTTSATLIIDTSPEETLEIVVPVGVHEDLVWVDFGTATVMLAMFFFLLHVSIRTTRRLATKHSAKTD